MRFVTTRIYISQTYKYDESQKFFTTKSMSQINLVNFFIWQEFQKKKFSLNFASKECLITPKSLQTLLMNPTLNGLFFSFSFFNIRE